ncbi:arginyl-tRNA--protein transferase 1-like isoform X1 [Eriocheir sinensis]|uniref:arginyl-tRNA--protein transferase 1-like isoform X1 n=1 Tax=Eriocheir sinensis TaxID=95602 RepID=UPI0021C812D2|nr:arginyl-tRNA--protein transferase 1-like isoform X1 [Eriocheir sinensis]XP_050695261.1 arginyl-tRNA--protein transferase 1-like isoform X1 [Eriocheir sinensis]XP_050695262.1 arginyl-tRNA--protein transferase 1-like isoform X1 [Eriocheir sinensis]
MAAEEDPSCSIVEYMRDHSGYKCGYCKSKNTNFSHGMWAHRMTTGDYQTLIDRGWRRSGKYCYKPTMDKTCCPMYTIKCDALELKLSKTQKKVLKRMRRYLSHGDRKDCRTPEMGNAEVIGDNEEYVKPKFEAKCDVSSVTLPKSIRTQEQSVTSNIAVPETNVVPTAKKPSDTQATSNASSSTKDSPSINQEVRMVVSSGTGPDASRPLCRKAKLIRREKREAKLAKQAQEALARGESLMEASVSKPNNTEKSLEDYLNEPPPANPAHTLEVRLVRSQPSSAEFLQTFKKAHQVYQRYQITIHGDAADKCNESQYKRFLCNSPLEQWQPSSGPELGYGSFHHQYWLDDRLIAVGVLDILPHCVSSVYLYYDPEYSFLSLGTYASLRELALVRELQQRTASLRWYYMGFYIHSCPKMRYKGKYKPSYLLCPETYEWISIELATPKLDRVKYSRLTDNPSAVDVNGRVDTSKILILHNQMLIRYGNYQADCADDDEDEEINEYASLVGAKSAYSLLLCRS